MSKISQDDNQLLRVTKAFCLKSISYYFLFFLIGSIIISSGWGNELSVPNRSTDAITRQSFIKMAKNLSLKVREKFVLTEILTGNMPAFLKKLSTIIIKKKLSDGQVHTAKIFVTKDYLSLGSNKDFLRIPVNFLTAKIIAQHFNAIIPTKKLVDDIYHSATKKLRPRYLPPGPLMTTLSYYDKSNQMIQADLGLLFPRELIGGHKKDIVLSNRLLNKPNRIAIYGWHRISGRPIQPLSTIHISRYVDYSHGLRLISKKVLIDGEIWDAREAFSHPFFWPLFSDEGPISKILFDY